MTTVVQPAVSRIAAEDFLAHEAELLDHGRFEEWHQLFTPDGTYVIPLSDDEDFTRHAAIVNDNPLRLEERGSFERSSQPAEARPLQRRRIH